MLNFDDVPPKFDSDDLKNKLPLNDDINSFHLYIIQSNAAPKDPKFRKIYDWLENARQFSHDTVWLTSHRDRLYQTIAKAIQQPQVAQKAIDTLFDVGHFMFMQTDHERWTRLLFEALNFAHNLGDQTLIMHIYTLMAHGFMMEGTPKAARTALYNALARSIENMERAEIALMAHLALLRAETYEQTGEMTEDRIEAAKKLARDLNDDLLTALLNMALAGYYMHRHNLSQTLVFGQMALGYWYQKENHTQIARTLMAIAPAYRVHGKYAMANTIMQGVHQRVRFTHDPVYVATVAYEQGVVDYYLGKYDTAERWLLNALDCADPINARFIKTMAEHMLGLIYVQMEKYDLAQVKLEAGLAGWREIKVPHEECSILYDLGELAFKQQAFDVASAHLQAARQVCMTLPEDRPRDYLQGLIDALLGQLPA